MNEDESRKKAIAERLRIAREYAGLSQGQVAKMLALHRPSISEIEAGRRNVTAEELAELARIYDVSVTWLLGKEAETRDEAFERMELAARELSKLKTEDLDQLINLLLALKNHRYSNMRQKRELARKAIDDAVRLRFNTGISLTTPIDIFDFTSNLGIDVRFVDISSMEAMYIKGDPPRILISSHRPPGRQVYSCAHELGHHYYKHGTTIDEYIEDSRNREFNPEEFLVECFAGFLLMPKTLVNYAFHSRGWSITNGTPLQFYTISGWLGVGYSTLINQAKYSLNLITFAKFNELQKSTPREIRKELLGREVTTSLIVVDSYWSGRAIDIQVGDYVQLPSGTDFSGGCVKPVSRMVTNTLYQALTPGLGRFFHPNIDWASYVRVSRRGYVGRSIFRHLEDPDNE